MNALNHSKTGTGHYGRPKLFAASVAVLLVAAMWALVTLSGGPQGTFASSHVQAPVTQAPARQSSGIQPGEVFHFTPAQTAELRRLTDTPEKAKTFQANMAKGMAAFGLRLSSQAPSVDGSAGSLNVQTADYTGGVTTEDVFSQGWDRDHWWLIMSYADVAYVGTAGAAAACSARLPWWMCVPIGGIIASWVRGWGSANNHGIWLAVYRTGWVTGGRW